MFNVFCFVFRVGTIRAIDDQIRSSYLLVPAWSIPTNPFLSRLDRLPPLDSPTGSSIAHYPTLYSILQFCQCLGQGSKQMQVSESCPVGKWAASSTARHGGGIVIETSRLTDTGYNRYHPDWEPSWKKSGEDFFNAEDGQPTSVSIIRLIRSSPIIFVHAGNWLLWYTALLDLRICDDEHRM